MINYYINLEIVAKSSNANSFFLLFHADNFYEGGGEEGINQAKDQISNGKTYKSG